MAHSIYSATGGINSLSATVSVASGAHVFALVNASSAAAFIEIDCDTDCTFNPDYSAGTNPVNLGGNWVVSNANNKLTYKIPAASAALFEITLASGDTGELTLNTSNSNTAHGSAAANHQRVWLAQV